MTAIESSGGHGELGTDVDLGGEAQRLAVVEVGDLDLGLAQGAHAGVADGLGVGLRQRVIDRLFEHGAAADPLFDDAGRRLARPKARNPHRLADPLVGRVEAGLELVEAHLDG